MRILAGLLSAFTAYMAVGYLTGRAPDVRIPSRRRPQVSDRQLWLIQAGSDLTPHQFVGGSMAIALVVFLAGLGMVGVWWLAAVPAAAAYLFPRMYYARRRAERLDEVREAWPDGLRDVLASIGAAGIPHAGLVMMLIILQAVGLPVEMQGIIIGVDRVLDMCRTSVNVWSDSCGCAVIDRFESGGAAPAVSRQPARVRRYDTGHGQWACRPSLRRHEHAGIAGHASPARP